MVSFGGMGLGTRGTDECIHIVPYIIMLMTRCRF